jgi:hypothetical protein
MPMTVRLGRPPGWPDPCFCQAKPTERSGKESDKL